MLSSVAKKIFGTRNDRVIRGLRPLVSRVNELESKYKEMTDEALASQTLNFKERISKGESLESIQPEAFAVVREASRRALGMRHFDVQLIGGAVLHMGMISEMRTGEGKTLVATLPAYLNALSGKGVHVVTVNDYLAKRDAEWMGRVYKFLGLSVGVVTSIRSGEIEKKKAYSADITYGQNNEFGFDYLRDNMKFSLDEQFQSSHNFAIVDEVDSILIDEARTPLIISGPAEEATDKYYKINKIIPYLVKDKHFQIELRTKSPTLTEEGIAECEKLLSVENLYDPRHIELVHHVNQALRAHTTLERDKDYVVKDGKIIIVDEFTGRLMDGRRWSNGLHQAVEAKEGLQVHRENLTLASITFQNFFRLYNKLAGMTGTADTEAVEFKKIYNLDVVVIPTNKPMIRLDQSDVVFRTRNEKYNAVVDDIAEINESGQPILVGTISIEQSEALSRALSKKGIEHHVLNAKHHEREAEIVAQAGRFGAVTIATNMAGRGTDIILGGNPEFLAFAEAGTKERSDPKFLESLEYYTKECAEEREKVIKAGGLFILGTERHESRRIDNQLRGRSGRQGDPGKSRFYVALEDDLMVRFGGERLRAIMQRLGWEEGVSLDGGLISRSIETAQKKVEAFHFEQRKHILEYDDVMNKQRQVIYNLRSKILHNEDVHAEVKEMLIDIVEETVLEICDEKQKPIEWDLSAITERLSSLCNFNFDITKDTSIDRQSIFDALRKKAENLLEERAVSQQAKLNELAKLASQKGDIDPGSNKAFSFVVFEQNCLLENLDKFWNVHIQDMEDLRDGIGLRAYGQKNPLYEYQSEGFQLFQNMLKDLKQSVLKEIFYTEFMDPSSFAAHLEAEERRREALKKQMKTIHQSSLEGSEEGDGGPNPQQEQRDPNTMRAKLEAERKARRQKKK